MATYVTSDVHGHLRALDRALELAQPGAHDTVYVLGDMVDRGPEPAAVLKLVRGLDNARVLRGNHEQMLLATVLSDSDEDTLTWHMNGGYTTAQSLDALPREEYVDLLGWVASLPLFDVVETESLLPSAVPGEHRVHLLCHAGIDALSMRGYLAMAGYAEGGYADIPLEAWRDAMAAQDPEDLLWIRAPFWSAPTGLVGPDGRGPVVIAGHTPSILLGRYAELMAGTGADAENRGVMVEVGAAHATGGVSDRIDIDFSSAVRWLEGRVGIMRLEDRRIWYANIEEGE